jgi:hypothetical protein
MTWLSHDGGAMPVAPDTMVECRGRYAAPDHAVVWMTIPARAGDVRDWSNVAEYRIITPAPDPRDAEIARVPDGKAKELWAAYCDAATPTGATENGAIDLYDIDGMDEAAHQLYHHAKDAEAEVARLTAEVERMRGVLKAISKQKRTDELDNEYEVECCDFEGGYDFCINTARAAMRDAPSDYERKLAQLREDFPNGI